MSFRALIELTDNAVNRVHVQNWTSGRAEYGNYYDFVAGGNAWVSEISNNTDQVLATSAGTTVSYYVDIDLASVNAISAYSSTQVRLLYTTSANEELTSELVYVNNLGSYIPLNNVSVADVSGAVDLSLAGYGSQGVLGVDEFYTDQSYRTYNNRIRVLPLTTGSSGIGDYRFDIYGTDDFWSDDWNNYFGQLQLSGGVGVWTSGSEANAANDKWLAIDINPASGPLGEEYLIAIQESEDGITWGTRTIFNLEGYPKTGGYIRADGSVWYPQGDLGRGVQVFETVPAYSLAGSTLSIADVSGAVNASLSAYQSASAGVAAYTDLAGISVTGVDVDLDYIISGIVTGSVPLIVSGVISGVTEHGDTFWTKIVGIPLDQFKILVE